MTDPDLDLLISVAGRSLAARMEWISELSKSQLSWCIEALDWRLPTTYKGWWQKTLELRDVNKAQFMSWPRRLKYDICRTAYNLLVVPWKAYRRHVQRKRLLAEMTWGYLQRYDSLARFSKTEDVSCQSSD